MKVTDLFEAVSQKMRIDFDVSAKFKHHGNRGDYREDSIKAFLCNGHLPKNFSIASGEVISQYSQVSKQIDLIVYDSNKSITFDASESTKIFPIESVLGIIEVKSKLSKDKLIEGLENIKALKQLHSPQIINRNYGDRVKIGYYNNPPFGLIFAYSLSGNSLKSLEENLKEWCSKNPPEVWPNLICILNVGIIMFQNGMRNALISSEIKSSSHPIAFSYAENSLFEFTSSLLTLCSNRDIEIFNIGLYKNPGLIVENLRVKFKDDLKNSKGDSIRLSNEFIKLIYENRGQPILYKDFIKKLMQNLDGPKDLFDDRTDQVYVYDPDNLPSIADVMNNNHENKNLLELFSSTPMFGGGIHFFINEQTYYVPMPYINLDNTVAW